MCVHDRFTCQTAQRTHFIAPGLEFGRPGRPAVSLFPSLSKEGLERREAPGSLRDSLPALRRPVRAKIPGPIGFEGGGGPGARGPCEGPGASRRSNAMPVVGHRTLLPLRTSRSTTPSIEPGCPYRTNQEHDVNPAARAARMGQHLGYSRSEAGVSASPASPRLRPEARSPRLPAPARRARRRSGRRSAAG